MSAAAQDGLAAPRRYWAVATVIVAIAMAALDGSIANTALPTIAADIRTSPASAIWVVNAYQLALVAALLPCAALGEIRGFRTVYLGGVAVFTLGSLLCGLSWSLPTLVAARVVQGLGAAGLMSVNVALVRFIYPTSQMGRGMGLNALTVATFTAVGPTVAAGILSVASWQWLFIVNVPLGVVALALALLVLPETPRATHRFDVPSAALNALAFGALVFAIGEAGHSAAPVVIAGVAAVAVLAGWALVRRQLRLVVPLLPIDLYRHPVFALSSATSTCSFAAQGLAYVALPFLFQMHMGRSAVETGLLLTPWPVATAIMAPIAGPMSDRYPPAVLGGIGMAILCCGLLLVAGMPDDAGPVGIGLRMLMCGAGFGFFQSPNLKALMSAAPRGRTGSASGIVATSRLVGQSTGAALVALCFGVSPGHGPGLALVLGAGFSGLACVLSLSRLAVGARGRGQSHDR